MFIILLPLYSIPKSGNYEFNTYHKHYIKNLQIKTFTYNPYLLITLKNNYALEIIKMQINNTLILGDAKFLTKK